MDLEYARRGNYERIYPREDSFLYNTYFHEIRKNNLLVTNYLFKQSCGGETDVSKLLALQRKYVSKQGVTNKMNFKKKNSK